MTEREEIELELADLDLRIAGIKEYTETHRARRLLPIIKKSGYNKGEVYDLTPAQYYKFHGSRPSKASIFKGKVPWEYCLDELAGEAGIKENGGVLKYEIEDIGKKLKELQELKIKRNVLIEELGIKKMPKVKAEPKAKRKAKVTAKAIREKTYKPKRKLALTYDKKRIPIDGKVTAYEITRGKERVGYLVAFPPTYGIYPNAKGLNIRQTPLAGAKSVKKAKERAKEVL